MACCGAVGCAGGGGAGVLARARRWPSGRAGAA
nr:MAG TPA: hypothetical protein [Caudoviricetes sp.]DAO89460.1 MAG TPA: hypothetical protein [Caudoviricetes sp.]DAS56134.1 MAG TPA: hypothetical protein [Caudoviricetes sp.]